MTREMRLSPWRFRTQAELITGAYEGGQELRFIDYQEIFCCITLLLSMGTK